MEFIVSKTMVSRSLNHKLENVEGVRIEVQYDSHNSSILGLNGGFTMGEIKQLIQALKEQNLIEA